jgi:hypothetical protein
MKVFLAAAVAGAVAVGLALPVPHASEAAQPQKSQFSTLELGNG